MQCAIARRTWMSLVGATSRLKIRPAQDRSGTLSTRVPGRPCHCAIAPSGTPNAMSSEPDFCARNRALSSAMKLISMVSTGGLPAHQVPDAFRVTEESGWKLVTRYGPVPTSSAWAVPIWPLCFSQNAFGAIHSESAALGTHSNASFAALSLMVISLVPVCFTVAPLK